jgi:hypothetical protein
MSNRSVPTFQHPSRHPTPPCSSPTRSHTDHGGTRVRVHVHKSADLVRELVDPSVATVIDDGDECELHFGTDDLDWAARWLAYLNLDIDVIEPTVLTDQLRTLGRWLLDRH